MLISCLKVGLLMTVLVKSERYDPFVETMNDLGMLGKSSGLDNAKRIIEMKRSATATKASDLSQTYTAEEREHTESSNAPSGA